MLAVISAVTWGFGASFVGIATKGKRNVISGYLVDRISGSVLSFLYLLIIGNGFIIPYENAFYAICAGLSGSTGFLFYYLAITKVGAPKATVISSSRPLIAAFSAVLLLRENITAPIIIGTLLVVLGVYWVFKEKIKN